jgi:hypothetical protein
LATNAAATAPNVNETGSTIERILHLFTRGVTRRLALSASHTPDVDRESA